MAEAPGVAVGSGGVVMAETSGVAVGSGGVMTGVVGVAVGNGGTGVGLATISGVGEGATFASSGDLEHAETETNSAAMKYFFIMFALIVGFRVFLSRDIPVLIPATHNGEVPTLIAGEKTPAAWIFTTHLADPQDAAAIGHRQNHLARAVIRTDFPRGWCRGK